MQLAYAESYAERDQPIECLGTIARVLLEEAHSRLARDGVWVTNEKRLLAAAALAHAEEYLTGVDLRSLHFIVEEVRNELEQ